VETKLSKIHTLQYANHVPMNNTFVESVDRKKISSAGEYQYY